MILGVTRDLAVLNELLGQTIGSIDRYCQAAGARISPTLRGALAERIAERHRVVGQLRHEIRRLGGAPRPARPVPCEPVPGAPTGDVPVLRGLDGAEGQLMHSFAEALGEGGLSPAVLVTVARSYAAIRAAQDEIRRLRHAMETAD